MIRRAAVLCMLAALVVRAEEPASTGDDAIAKAKRDYEAIKAAKAGRDQPGTAALPHPDAPSIDLHLTADLPAPSTSPDAKKRDLANARSANKSANWLVDAMNEAKEGTGKDGKEGLTLGEEETDLLAGGTDLLARNRALVAEKKAAAAAGGEHTGAPGKSRSAAAPNPLASYMATWMTPKDFALLNPKNGGPGALPTPGGAGLPEPGPGFAANVPASGDPGLTGGLADALASNPSAPGPADLAPKPNPYLADFKLPSPPPVVVPGAPSPSVNLPAPAPAALLPVNPPAPPPARVSPLLEQAQKAQEDAKYFKQLKRF